MASWIKQIIDAIPDDAVNRQVRGAVLITDAEYVRREFGEQMIPAIYKFAREQGYELDYSIIKPMEWYPIELRFVSLMSIKTVMQWKDEDLRTMGSKAPTYSLITRLLLRYMMNLDMLTDNIQKYWNKNYNFGIVIARNIPGTVYICIKDCPAPKYVITYMEGYFSSALGMVIGRNKVIGFEESRWKHNVGECLEFAIRYKE
jgi:hypothetical protein